MHDRRLIALAAFCALLLAAGLVVAISMRDDGPTQLSTGGSGDDTSTTALSPSTPGQEGATTTQPAKEPASATTRHQPSGLVFTLTSSAGRFASGEEVAFTLVVRNESAETRVYNSSPGPRFAFTANGEQVWNDGCETAYAAMFTTGDIAPGAEVTFTGKYPQTLSDPRARENCEQPAGTYELTGLFTWCPTGGDCEGGERITMNPVRLEIAAG